MEEPDVQVGGVSVSSYTREQLERASGTLFGTHHRRVGRDLVELGDDSTRLSENLQRAELDIGQRGQQFRSHDC